MTSFSKELPVTSLGPSEPPPGTTAHRPLLEYVTLPHCGDCVRFERQLANIASDFPGVDAREVSADTPRGWELSVARGVMRFPVIVFDGEIIGVESISEQDLRRHLAGRSR
jgi:glutaredoxin